MGSLELCACHGTQYLATQYLAEGQILFILPLFFPILMGSNEECPKSFNCVSNPSYVVYSIYGHTLMYDQATPIC